MPTYMAMVTAPQSGSPTGEKSAFWQLIIDVSPDIPDTEMILLGGHLNGHVGMYADGYVEVHGGFGFGVRNDGGYEIMHFGRAISLILCNTSLRVFASKRVTWPRMNLEGEHHKSTTSWCGEKTNTL